MKTVRCILEEPIVWWVRVWDRIVCVLCKWTWPLGNWLSWDGESSIWPNILTYIRKFRSREVFFSCYLL